MVDYLRNKNVKRILAVLTIFFLVSCNNSLLQKENDELKAQVEALRLESERQGALAEEVAIMARIAQAEAEKQAEIARIEVAKARKILEECN